MHLLHLVLTSEDLLYFLASMLRFKLIISRDSLTILRDYVIFHTSITTCKKIVAIVFDFAMRKHNKSLSFFDIVWQCKEFLDMNMSALHLIMEVYWLDLLTAIKLSRNFMYILTVTTQILSEQFH